MENLAWSSAFRPILRFSKKPVEIAFRVLFFSLVAIILFSRVATASISHDEYQFVASGQWFAQQFLLPYIDYPFLHMPYQVFVNGIAAAASDYDLLVVRCVSDLFYLGSAVLLYSLVARLFAGRPALLGSAAASLATAVFLFDASLMSMDGRALNHSLPIFLTLLCFALYQGLLLRPRSVWRLFLCGLCAGLAAGVRLSFAVVALPFLFVLVIQSGFKQWAVGLKKVLWYSSGLILALLPVGLLFAAAPMPFYFGNYVYIRLNTVYRAEVGFETGMNFLSKLFYLKDFVLVNPISLLLYLGLIFTSFYALIRFLICKDSFALELALVVSLGWAQLAAAFAPTPLWPQYFFAPIPFMILAVFYGLSRFNRPLAVGLSTAALGIALIAGFPLHQTTRPLSDLAHPDQWPPVQVHQFAGQIHTLVPLGKVLTLAPILPLETGLDTYPEFTVSPFVWRTAPLLSAQARSQFHLVSFHELDSLLKASPPGAFLTGLETDYGFDEFDTGNLERPLIDYAASHGYQPRYQFHPTFWTGDITLWVKP